MFTGKYKHIFVISGLIIVTLAVYWQVGNFEFLNYDDNQYITENSNILNGLTIKSIKWAFTEAHFFMWHPVTSLSHIVDYQFFKLNPRGHHFTSLFFHLANVLILFGILNSMTARFWPSALVAAVFAVHPLNVESVAWVAERKTILSGFFCLLTVASYIRYIKKPLAKNYILMIFVFALALMSKPTAVTLPFVLLLLDYWPLNRIQFKKNQDFHLKIIDLIKEKIPLFLMSAALCVITVITQKGGDVLILNKQLPLVVRAENALVSYATYIIKMIYPTQLAPFYPHPGLSLPLWKPVISLVFLAVISIGIFYLSRKKSYILAGWLWFLGTLVPVIGIVQAGEQAMADRYAYIPLVGLFILVVWGTNDLLSNWRYGKILAITLSISAVSALSISAAIQTTHWRNSTTLFEYALKVNNRNYLACNNLGYALLEQNKLEDAVNLFQSALKIKSDYVDAYINLGMAYGKMGRYQEVINVSEEAIKINPDYSNAYNNLALAYARLGLNKQAIEAYNKAIRIAPDDSRLHFNIGLTYVATGDKDAAVKQYEILKSLDSELAKKFADFIK